MVSFWKALRYPTIATGLVLLFISLLLAFASMTSEVVKTTESGVLEPGSYYLEPKSIVVLTSANLTLSAEKATVTVTWANNFVHLTLANSTEKVKNITEPPTLVTDGSLKYRLDAVGVRYPYSWLSVVGFVTMIAGSVLSLLGFASYMQGELEKTKKKKKTEKGRNER
ncbi:hypothetical protein [Pyrococcus yayanosii]|uniref:Uncharacterized protein n=1 Tax=Pyrococcus yayanosii (strain CH1 / JCM 16557) TaxID=529709 RepID=F8AGW6_PYRYC|nr:hypothetical protein [Pyrococcus yayanosii]AEH25257.1 hypothetical protein PYCH_15910 [Pyrococcus yayanosii CH1]